MGVTVAPGVVVADVEDGMPAQEAGLARGGVILAVKGEQLRQVVHSLEDSAEVALRFNRAEEMREVKARLVTEPAG
ncbi:MAG: PDZ domain-containing protein [Gemmataceae bacterium]